MALVGYGAKGGGGCTRGERAQQRCFISSQFTVLPKSHHYGLVGEKINMFVIFCFLYTVLLLEINNLAKAHLFSCAPNR